MVFSAVYNAVRGAHGRPRRTLGPGSPQSAAWAKSAPTLLQPTPRPPQAAKTSAAPRGRTPQALAWATHVVRPPRRPHRGLPARLPPRPRSEIAPAAPGNTPARSHAPGRMHGPCLATIGGGQNVSISHDFIGDSATGTEKCALRPLRASGGRAAWRGRVCAPSASCAVAFGTARRARDPVFWRRDGRNRVGGHITTRLPSF